MLTAPSDKLLKRGINVVDYETESNENTCNRINQ